MNFKQLNVKTLAGISALAILAACNNSSSDSISDTAAASIYSSADTTMQSAPADTSTMAAPADTSSMSATAPNTTTSNTAAKKKGKISVVMMPAPKHPKIEMDKMGIYEYSEVMPVYPGGKNAIDNYVNGNIEYPQPALDNGKEGRVLVAFTVDEDGKVMNAHTTGAEVGDGLDKEAVRVVSNMPKWTPGMVKGKPVKTRMTLPITFQIQE